MSLSQAALERKRKYDRDRMTAIRKAKGCKPQGVGKDVACVCGKVFRWRPSCPKEHCSGACRKEQAEKKRQKQCKTCSTSFVAEKPKNQFCSFDCYNESRKQRTEVNCTVCGKSAGWRIPSSLKDGRQPVCSPECNAVITSRWNAAQPRKPKKLPIITLVKCSKCSTWTENSRTGLCDEHKEWRRWSGPANTKLKNKAFQLTAWQRKCASIASGMRRRPRAIPRIKIESHNNRCPFALMKSSLGARASWQRASPWRKWSNSKASGIRKRERFDNECESKRTRGTDSPAGLQMCFDWDGDNS